VISESLGVWKSSFPRNNLEAVCHNIRVIHSFTGARWPRSRANTCVNQLLVVNDMKVMATFITYRLHFSTEPSAPIKSAPYQFSPRPWMVARDSSRIFPTQSIRSTGSYPDCWINSYKELPRLHPVWSYQSSLGSAKSTAQQRRCPYLLPTSPIHPSGSHLTCGAHSYKEQP
jgi:hypothetical protein